MSIAEIQIKREEELQQCPMTLASPLMFWRRPPVKCPLSVFNVRPVNLPGLSLNTLWTVAQGEEEVEETPAEVLYLGMLPNLSQYVVSKRLPTNTRAVFRHLSLN